jgi:hypothetical protein
MRAPDEGLHDELRVARQRNAAQQIRRPYYHLMLVEYH